MTLLIARYAGWIDRWHWLLLMAVAPLLLFPSPGRSWALLVVPGLWIIAWLARREPIPRTPLNASMLLLALMVLVSTWATYDLAVSLPKIAGVVLGIGVLYAFVRYGQSPRGWWLCLLVFMASGGGVMALGLLGTKWGTKIAFLSPLVSRLPYLNLGLQGAESGLHPNEVAGALVWMLPLFLTLSALAFVRPKAWLTALGRWLGGATMLFLAGATLLLALTLLLTQSRGGYIGLGVACLALFFAALPSRRQGFFLIALVIVVILIGGAVWQYGLDGLLRLAFGGSNPIGEAATSLDTLEGRVEVWSRAIYGVQDFPFTGMGMNTFRKVVHVLYPLFLVSPDTDLGHAHNEFLQAALDLGIPGLIAFLSLYMGAFWMLWRIADYGLRIADGEQRMADDREPSLISNLQSLISPRALAWGLGGGLLAHVVYGLTDAVSLGAKPGFLFWMLLGLITALYQNRKEC